MPWHPITKLKRFDAQRDSLPGEHWLTLAAGIGLWVATRKHPSGAVRLVAGIAGGLLAARALSGTQVPRRLKAVIPYAGWEPVSSPMPKRVA